MTFSLVGRCARSGRLGVAISSSSPAVAARCAHVRAATGAVATQNITDPRLGPRTLDLLAGGAAAADAVAAALAGDPTARFRQLLCVDAEGRSAIASGADALGTVGEARGVGCASAGNLLATPDVPAAMVAAFEGTAELYLGERLMRALEAAIAEGGEAGPVRSCGIVVADRVAWPVVDLRVDWDEDDPIARLRSAWTVFEPQIDAYVQRGLDPAGSPGYGVPGDDREG